MSVLYWFDSPGYGSYDGEEFDFGRSVVLCKYPSSAGEGKWCEKCLEVGHYSWLDFLFKVGDYNYGVYSFCNDCDDRVKEGVKDGREFNMQGEP